MEEVVDTLVEETAALAMVEEAVGAVEELAMDIIEAIAHRVTSNSKRFIAKKSFKAGPHRSDLVIIIK